MPQNKYLPNLIVEKLISGSRNIISGMADINGGMPLGAKPKSIKEQLEEFLNMTEQDKMLRFQEWGADKFIEWNMDMEKKLKKSDSGFLGHYGVEEM